MYDLIDQFLPKSSKSESDTSITQCCQTDTMEVHANKIEEKLNKANEYITILDRVNYRQK